jgi:hypothetical protein
MRTHRASDRLMLYNVREEQVRILYGDHAKLLRQFGRLLRADSAHIEA